MQQNVQMDGSINFQTNGDINVYPCPWESDKEVTSGERVRYEGGIEVMKQLFRDETIEVAAYLATRKTNTLWTNNQ